MVKSTYDWSYGCESRVHQILFTKSIAGELRAADPFPVLLRQADLPGKPFDKVLQCGYCWWVTKVANSVWNLLSLFGEFDFSALPSTKLLEVPDKQIR